MKLILALLAATPLAQAADGQDANAGAVPAMTAEAEVAMEEDAPAQAEDSRPILWDKVRAGMTTAEVRALYPEGGDIDHKRNRIELDDQVILEGCEAEIDIMHRDGVVDMVKVRGDASLGGRCSDKVLGALSAKYGQPMVERETAGSILARESEITVWNKGGITMRFKQFTNGLLRGGGLGGSSWELQYTASASEISLGAKAITAGGRSSASSWACWWQAWLRWYLSQGSADVLFSFEKPSPYRKSQCLLTFE